jgi:hypothetical protein
MDFVSRKVRIKNSCIINKRKINQQSAAKTSRTMRHLLVNSRNAGRLHPHAQCHADVELLVEEHRLHNGNHKHGHRVHITLPLWLRIDGLGHRVANQQAAKQDNINYDYYS